MSQEQFLRLMKDVIRSVEVRASVESLVARSNEVDFNKNEQVEDESEV